MQDFELESFALGVDHSQMVKATPNANDYSSKDCVNLSPSTAVSRIIGSQGLKSKREWVLMGLVSRLDIFYPLPLTYFPLSVISVGSVVVKNL